MENKKELAKKKIELLVNEFKLNFNKIKNYNEEETKRKLIEPFFEALGWSFASQGKKSEVHYEHKAHKTKSRRVDYIVGKGKGNFLIEAKQVSKKLDGSVKEFIIQANNYAWNKGMFCVLTDFEEFQLIKPIKPNKKKPEVCIVPEYYELGFEEYLSKFDLFYDTFSKEAVENGSLDILLEKEKKKRKFYTIDDDFLADLENWRKKLANDIYKNNTENVGNDPSFLSELTQRVLDRIIFTRILEDREIEPYFIQNVLDKENIYVTLTEYFKKLRPKYNGLIYNEHPIDSISVSDKVLKEILVNVCDIDRNEVVYQFDQIPVEILGSIYERFLGKTLQIHPDKKRDCVTLEKTYLTKDTGIYYTPDYVVEYICENTIGRMFTKKTPKQVENIKIIDTACGSGSFLVGAYTYLLNWYEDYYNANPEKLKKATVTVKEKIREADGSFSILSQQKLSRNERRRILIQHIYGVDIDNQAVEVTQMSLFLKMLEDNYDEQQELALHDIILPNLSDNIVCGNTLLDKSKDLSKDEKRKLKPFKWEDYFPDIIKWKYKDGNRVLEDGYGFDIIIGNPPYVKQYTNNQIFEDLRKSYIFKYYEGKMDYWYLFACQAIDLLKKGGLHSYIATSNWNTSAGSSNFRNKLLNETKLISLIDFLDYKVFQNAGIQTMIYIAEKKSLSNAYDMSFLKFLQKDIPDTLVSETLSSISSIENQTTDLFTKFTAQINVKKIGNNIFTFNDKNISQVLEKLDTKKEITLNEKDVAQGIVGAPDKCFLVKEIKDFSNEEKYYLREYYTNSEKYQLGTYKDFIFYICENNFKSNKITDYPNIKNHFEPFKKELKEAKIKYKTPNKPYFYLHRDRDERFFEKGKKIVCAIKTKYPKFHLTDVPFYGSRALNFIKTEEINNIYLTTLLNSNLSYFYLYFSGKKQGDQLQIDKGPLLSIPIATPSKNDIEIVTNLYDSMIENIEDYYSAKSDYDKKSARTDIYKTDKEINQFFYKKYELTASDIEIIESNLPDYDFLH